MKEVIIASLEKGIVEVKAGADKEIAVIREKLMKEKILPFNEEIDAARVKAEQELAVNLNKNISALQEKYNKDRQALFDAGQKKKEEFEKSVIATATYEITKERDKAVTRLQNQINDLKE